MDYPGKVTITEVGPRDGLQLEVKAVPLDQKVALIDGLIQAGLKAIQVASFVHPLKVPQMADAEKIIERLSGHDGVAFSALTLNHKGVQRAVQTGVPWIEVSVAASDSHSRINAGLPLELIAVEIDRMMNAALNADRKVRASIQCAFGCSEKDPVEEKQVLKLSRTLLDYGIHQLVLADTTGMATPLKVRRLLGALLPMTAATSVGLHLHDTRGLGLVNVMVGLEMGIDHFDTSLGGLGGCPFISGAAGNIATEDTVYLLDSLGIDTGIDIPKVACWSHRLSRFFNRTLQGKIYRLHPRAASGYACDLNNN